MSSKVTFLKTPGTDVVVDYLFKWEDWLEDLEVISEYELDTDFETGGLTIVDDFLVDSDKNVQIWISGEIPEGSRSSVTCHVTTSSGPVQRQDKRTLYIECVSR